MRPLGNRASFRVILLALLILGVGPTLVFSGVLLLRYAASERERAEHALIESAKGIAHAVDAQFDAMEATLLSLRSSPAFDGDDLAAIDDRLRRVHAATGRPYALLEPDGRQVVNTYLPPGTPPTRGAPGLWDPLLAGGKTYVSNVFESAATKQLLVAVGLPVWRDGKIRWILTAGLFAPDLARVLEQSGVPADWIVSIVDRNGVHLVRSRNSDQFAGKPLVSELIRHMQAGSAGTLRTTSLEGIDLVSTVQRAPKSGWGAAVGLPNAQLEGPLRASLRDLLLMGLIVLGVASGLALWLIRSLDRSMHSLTAAAERLGRREPLDLPMSMVPEVDAVAQALGKASHDLNELTTNLEAQVADRTAAISKANADLVAEMQRRKDSEAQVMQMQKTEAVGQLTGGIAHDFNNMLAVILGSLRLLQNRLARGDLQVDKYVEAARQAAERAASLTARLLAFSRQQPLAPTAVDVNGLVAGMGEILHRTIPENVRIETDLAADLWLAFADAQGLESAIINLAANARDAMPGGGTLTVATANASIDAAQAVQQDELHPGDYVTVAVVDSGHGMGPEVLRRAFDPFFTTKPVDRGTGLGLSQVHGYVKQSGGHVAIDSQPGLGTKVCLYLPRYAGAAAPGMERRRNGGGMPQAASAETILVVEDQADVRRLTVEMLQELGYATVEAGDGFSALELLARHPEIVMLFTDVIMPGMNGRQLADEALRRRPDLAVLFATGYTRDAIVHQGIVDPDVQVIMKPHTLESLAHKVSEALQKGQMAS